MAEEEMFTFGRMLSHLRKEIRGLSQAELADKMCAELEKRRSLVANPAKSISVDAMRTAISQAEKNKRRLDAPKREAAATSLGVPPIWFDNPAVSWRVFEQELDLWLQYQRASTIPKPLTTVPKTSQQQPKLLHRTNSLPKSPDHGVFKDRSCAFKELNTSIFGSSGSILFCLKGQLGLGKSTYLQHWFSSENKRLKGFGILAIHCVDKTGDDLRAEMISYYTDCGVEGAALQLSELVKTHPLILILDAIERLDMGDASGTNLSPSLFLESTLGPAFRRSANLKVVVSYAPEAAPGKSDVLTLLTDLAGVSRYRETELLGLNPNDGADLLSNCGLDVPYEVLRGISEKLEGNPTLLAAFIANVKRSTDSVQDRVQHLTILDDMGIHIKSPTIRTDLFRDLFIRLRSSAPEAFVALTVLAACRDGIESNDLHKVVYRLLDDERFLLGCGLEPSITAHDFDFLRGSLAGLIRTSPRVGANRKSATIPEATKSTSTKSLHALAHLELSNLLNEFIPPGERIQVHWELAQNMYGLLPLNSSRGYIHNTIDIERFHNLLYHLVSMYDIAAANFEKLASRRALRKTKMPTEGKMGSGRCAISVELAISDHERFIEEVFVCILLQNLGRENRVIGRQLGRFERKLSMLGLFFQVDEVENDNKLAAKKGLSVQSRKNLFHETAVAANYTGHLSIAHNAVRESIRTSRREPIPKPDEFFDIYRNSLVVGDKLEKLRSISAGLDEYSALLNVSATSYCREGRLSIADGLLERSYSDVLAFVNEADALARNENLALGDKSARVRGYFQGVILALRRVAAKVGQIKTYKNDILAASQAYNVARSLEHMRSGTNVLRGETGRIYCRFLLASDPRENIRLVLSNIEENVNHSKSLGRHYETVEWLIELLFVESVHGEVKIADAALAEIDSILRVEGISLSFSAQKELEIERCRLSIRKDLSFRPERLEVGLKSCIASGHELLACDIQILLSEACRNTVKGSYWRRASQEIMRRTEYSLPIGLGLLK